MAREAAIRRGDADFVSCRTPAEASMLVSTAPAQVFASSGCQEADTRTLEACQLLLKA